MLSTAVSRSHLWLLGFPLRDTAGRAGRQPDSGRLALSGATGFGLARSTVGYLAVFHCVAEPQLASSLAAAVIRLADGVGEPLVISA